MQELFAQYGAYAVGAASLIAVVLLIAFRNKIGRTVGPKWQPPVYYEIARIDEDATLSGIGVLCLLGLLGTQVVAVLSFVAMTNVMHQAAIGTVWTALNVFWGIGILVGRNRRYRVLREHERKDPTP